jgi:zinc and cadmium transporter
MNEQSMTLSYVVIFSALGSVGALAGAGALLAFPNLHYRLRTPLLAYATGTLLGATFIGLLPEALGHEKAADSVLMVVLAGFVGFFILEKLLRLPHVHAHADDHTSHQHVHQESLPAGTLILIGDAFHNFVDGVVIATAFSASIPLGILTSLAVIAHEIPQELGDFVILLESGWSKNKAFWWNFASALATIPGAIIAYFALSLVLPRVPYLLAIAASSFLYIATVDLAPILHHEFGFKKNLLQVAGLFAGIGTILGIHMLLG